MLPALVVDVDFVENAEVAGSTRVGTSVRVSNRTGKKVRLFVLSEPESNRSSLSLKLTNTNELNFRLSKN